MTDVYIHTMVQLVALVELWARDSSLPVEQRMEKILQALDEYDASWEAHDENH